MDDNALVPFFIVTFVIALLAFMVGIDVGKGGMEKKAVREGAGEYVALQDKGECVFVFKKGDK